MQSYNDIFAGDLQDMFMLAVEVIKVNFNGFFKKLADRSGAAKSIPKATTNGLASST
mgnify:FL=1